MYAWQTKFPVALYIRKYLQIQVIARKKCPCIAITSIMIILHTPIICPVFGAAVVDSHYM